MSVHDVPTFKADRELEQFTHERIDEGVCVPWLFGPKNVVLSEALLWREIVAENEDPCGMLPLFIRSEAIGGEAECDITMIREVIARVRPASNNNTLSKKRAVMEPIDYRSGSSQSAVMVNLVGLLGHPSARRKDDVDPRHCFGLGSLGRIIHRGGRGA